MSSVRRAIAVRERLLWELLVWDRLRAPLDHDGRDLIPYPICSAELPDHFEQSSPDGSLSIMSLTA